MRVVIKRSGDVANLAIELYHPTHLTPPKLLALCTESQERICNPANKRSTARLPDNEEKVEWRGGRMKIVRVRNWEFMEPADFALRVCDIGHKF